MKALWLRELDRQKQDHLREVLDTVGHIIHPCVYRKIAHNISTLQNPALLHKGRKP